MTCCICSSRTDNGTSFQDWVKDTFTDFDKLHPGDTLCNDCAFWFNERSTELAEKTGKDKPQRIRNYSHFIKSGTWTPLSKANKHEMQRLLLNGPFPELAIIADSGQKHIAFRARRNPTGGVVGWVQFEESSVWVEPEMLSVITVLIQEMLSIFSKSEIHSGRYDTRRIIQYGTEAWTKQEDELKHWRGQRIFDLAIFLSQKQEEHDDQRSLD